MNKQPYFLRYGLTITGAARGEWQGVLENEDGVREFESVMQLLCLIRQDERKRTNLPEDGFAGEKP